MEPLISVIVPIYNVELYLRQCVDSIINQTYQNLEIILVDDGSPDNCGTICDEYAEKDSRVVVLHKKNGGLSDARNTGLQVMHGDYLMFVDSDDCLNENCTQYLFNLAISNDADLVIGGVEKFDDDTGKIIWSTACERETVVRMTKQEAMKDMFLNGCASWARLYKAKIHKDICFPVGEINEDEAIVLQLLQQCNCVVKSNTVLYSYRYRSRSITSTNWHSEKLAWVEHCKSNLEFVSSYYPELIPYAKQRCISSLVWALNNMTADIQKFSDLIPFCRKELKEIMKESNWVDGFSAKEKLRAYLLAYCYYPFATVVRLLGKHYT